MSAEQDGRDRAEQYRAEHGLGDIQPLPDLVALIEDEQEVDVAVLDAATDEHGMTVRDPERGLVMIAVARTRHVMRQRSSLAHELGHLVFGDHRFDQDHGNWTGRDFVEVRADAFARHLLLPPAAVERVVAARESGGTSVSEADLSALVQMYLVSPMLAAIQLRGAKLIDEPTKTRWMDLTAPALAARHGWTDQYRALQGSSDTQRPPQRLLARATAGYVAGVLSLQAVARLRGTSEETVRRDFDDAGIVPDAIEVEWSSSDGLGHESVDLSDLDT